MKFEIDALHAFHMESGAIDDVPVVGRVFVQPGRHIIEADAGRVEKLEADGFLEIVDQDGVLRVWSPCCSGGH